MGWQGEQCERLHELGGEAGTAFLNASGRSPCPRRGPGRTVRHGHDRQGVRRWPCKGCGRTFTPATKTIFEDRKPPVQGWVEFPPALMPCESLTGIARRDRRSPTIPSCQLAELFLVLGGIRDAVVLTDGAQIDEMMCAVPVADRDPRLAGGRAGGLSKDDTRIAAACGGRGGGCSTFHALGQGKPGAGRARAACCPNLERGLAPVHDRENAHDAVVRGLGLVNEAYDARMTKEPPDDRNPLWKASRPCFPSRLLLDVHTGFDRSDLSGRLDLFPVMMNPPNDKLERAAMAPDGAMAFPNTLGYRDFHRQTPSSEYQQATESSTHCKRGS